MSPCGCCLEEENSSSTLVPPFRVTTSELSISVKEIVILSMIFFLLIYSVLAFLRNWKKNYRDISRHAQFTELSPSSSGASLVSEDILSRTGSRMSRIVRVGGMTVVILGVEQRMIQNASNSVLFSYTLFHFFGNTITTLKISNPPLENKLTTDSMSTSTTENIFPLDKKF